MRFLVRKPTDYRAWHRHFVWWPTHIDNFIVWLETVERREIVTMECDIDGCDQPRYSFKYQLLEYRP